MIFRRLGLINKNQKGLTLVEVGLVFGLIAIIAGGITMTFFQVINGSARANNHMIAVRQVQNAGYWVSHDAQMAQSVELGVPSGSLFTLTWIDGDNSDVHQVTYTVEEIDGVKQLKQSHKINLGVPTETIVAKYIVPGEPNTYPELIDDVLIFTVTASVGAGSQQQSETRVYKIVPRPS